MKAVTSACVAAACGLALGIASGGSALGQVAATENRGVIEAVTVYRGQALVTRQVALTGPGGLREVVVTDLPGAIEPESLHAESGTPGLEVRSVRYRVRPVAQDVREDVRKLDAQIKDLAERIDATQRRQAVLAEHRAYLEQLKNFAAPTATVEMTRGVLNAETLEKLTKFIVAQRDTIAESDLKLSRELSALQAELALRQRERGELTAGSSRSLREAVLLVNKAGDGPVTLRVRYLVNQATWVPSYAARTEGAREGVRLEYYAAISQLSGEDWGDVAMTLSTATPSLVARAPKLTPMAVTLASGQPQSRVSDPGEYREAHKQLADKRRQLEEERARVNVFSVQTGAAQQAQAAAPVVGYISVGEKFDVGLNRVAAEMQVLDLVGGGRGAVALGKDAGSERPSDEGLSVTYTISGRTSLPSRSDRQLVQITSIPLKAASSKVAIPVLTGYVYDEASAINTSGQVLLAGPLTAYANGAFVGSGELATIAAGESLTVGFGIDSSLRAARELVEKSETVQGGNRVVELTYRLSVQNFDARAARVTLSDRMPRVQGPGAAAGGGGDVRITMVSTTLPPDASESEDGPRRNGIVTWSLDVPAQAIGAKAAFVEYKFRIEHDKQMTLVGLDG